MTHGAGTVKKILIYASLVLMSGCAYKAYDAQNPTEYYEYWCDPKNINNQMAILGQLDGAQKKPEHSVETREQCLERQDRYHYVK